MNQDYITPDAWSIIEEGFDVSRVESSESLFSIGNGSMGQRANFEETYSGSSFQGSYIGGIFYPDNRLSSLYREIMLTHDLKFNFLSFFKLKFNFYLQFTISI